MNFKKLLKRIKYYDKITGMSKISRRYFIMNSFDGILTMLGVLLGSYFVGAEDVNLIIGAGIGASIAVGISGLWGAFLTESAERKKEIRVYNFCKHFLSC